MTSGYVDVTGKDLDEVFDPKFQIPKTHDVGYRIEGVDISNRYLPIQFGEPTHATGYLVNGRDLNTIFAKFTGISSSVFVTFGDIAGATAEIESQEMPLRINGSVHGTIDQSVKFPQGAVVTLSQDAVYLGAFYADPTGAPFPENLQPTWTAELDNPDEWQVLPAPPTDFPTLPLGAFVFVVGPSTATPETTTTGLTLASSDGLLWQGTFSSGNTPLTLFWSDSDGTQPSFASGSEQFEGSLLTGGTLAKPVPFKQVELGDVLVARPNSAIKENIGVAISSLPMTGHIDAPEGFQVSAQAETGFGSSCDVPFALSMPDGASSTYTADTIDSTGTRSSFSLSSVIFDTKLVYYIRAEGSSSPGVAASVGIASADVDNQPNAQMWHNVVDSIAVFAAEEVGEHTNELTLDEIVIVPGGSKPYTYTYDGDFGGGIYITHLEGGGTVTLSGNLLYSGAQSYPSLDSFRHTNPVPSGSTAAFTVTGSGSISPNPANPTGDWSPVSWPPQSGAATATMVTMPDTMFIKGSYTYVGSNPWVTSVTAKENEGLSQPGWDTTLDIPGWTAIYDLQCEESTIPPPATPPTNTHTYSGAFLPSGLQMLDQDSGSCNVSAGDPPEVSIAHIAWLNGTGDILQGATTGGCIPADVVMRPQEPGDS